MTCFTTRNGGPASAAFAGLRPVVEAAQRVLVAMAGVGVGRPDEGVSQELMGRIAVEARVPQQAEGVGLDLEGELEDAEMVRGGHGSRRNAFCVDDCRG